MFFFLKKKNVFWSVSGLGDFMFGLFGIFGMYQGLVALCFVEREGGGPPPLLRHRAWNFGFLNEIKLFNEKFNPGTGGGEVMG